MCKTLKNFMIFALVFASHPFAFSNNCQQVFTNQTIWTNLNSKIKKIMVENKDPESLFSIYNRIQRSDEHRVHLEILGFNFKKVKKFAPDIQTIIDNYIKFMLDKGLTKEEILIPAFPFQTLDQTSIPIFIPYGGDIPPSRKLYTGVLTKHSFNKALSLGYFPMGGAKPSNPQSGSFSLFEHDLAHLTSFMQNPEYMKLIKSLPHYASDKRLIINQDNLTNYYLVEGMVFPKKAYHKKLKELSLLGHSFLADPYSISIKQAEQILKQIPLEKVIKYSLHINDNFPLYFEAYGGAARDPVNKGSYEAHDPLFILSEKMMYYKFDPESFDLHAVATFLVTIHRLMEISPTQWFTDSLTPNFENSKTGKFLYSLRIEPEKNNVFKKFIPDQQ